MTSSPTEPSILLRCKLHVPDRGRQRVSRSALVEVLRAGRAQKLTLVDAPAGWGKTTLLAQWTTEEHENARFAWLSLDPSDNDPVRFWTYLVASLLRAEPRLADGASTLLQARADLMDLVLPTLLNDLANAEPGLVLVLDDYHVISDREIHRQVTFFIDHMPSTSRLVMATRSDPHLPLARLRARGDLLELRAPQLRFGESEADQLLNDMLALNLDPHEVSLLCERTEGWAAGLYLAGLSLADGRDAGPTIGAFAGNNRHIVDYLSTEVLDSQPTRVRNFLLLTSVLERLTGPLCDAVLQTSDSSVLLEQIERENLFLISLDSSRGVYRYHHLFAEVLRKELERTDPDVAPVLHQRAAAWFRSEGLHDNAVRHLVTGCDLIGAAELIVSSWGAEFNRGRLATVSSWLDLLAEPMVIEDPCLCLIRAWLALDLRQLVAAGRWIERAQAALTARSVPGDTAQAQIAHIQALRLLKLGNVTAALDTARSAIEQDVGESSPGRSAAYCVYGASLFWSGDEAQAQAAFGHAVELAETVDNQAARTYALGYLAIIAAQSGLLSKAEELIRTATEGDRDAAVSEHFVDMMTALAMAKVFSRRGENRSADRATQRAVLLAKRGGGNLEIANAIAARSEVLRQIGDKEGAKKCTNEVRTILDRCPDPGVARQLLAPPIAAGDIPPQRASLVGAEQLTAKELEVLRLLGTKLTRREIAQHLYVSINTVKTHQRGIFRKLEVRDRLAAAERARELGIL